MSSKGKMAYFEAMRIIACFFVIFDHVNDFSYGVLTTFCEWCNLFWYFFCRFSVPLFFMISGALLLKKNLSAKQLFNHIFKMIMILLIFSFLYYILTTCSKNEAIKLGDFIRQLYSSCGSFNASFWFLYAYIGFLVIIPFLKLIVTNMTKNHFYYLLVIMSICSFINIFEYFMLKGNVIQGVHILQGYNNFSWLANTSIFYPIVGYYLDNKVPIEKVCKKLPLLWIINFIFIMLSIVLTFCKIHILNIYDDNFQTFRWTFTYFNTIAIFLTIKHMCCVKKNLYKHLEVFFIKLGDCTFGIYLIHWALLFYIKPFINCDTVLSCFGMSCIVFFVCYLIVWLLKLVPIVDKYI